MDLILVHLRISSFFSPRHAQVAFGPAFLLCWRLFPAQDPWAPYYAAAIPFAITAKFAAVGLAVIRDPLTVAMLARRGHREEILLGPLHYGVAFVLTTLIFWRQPLVALLPPLFNLCVGDAAAALVGQRYGRHHWPRSSKTIEGSLSFVISSWLCSAAVLFLVQGPSSLGDGVNLRLIALAVVGALTELLAPSDWDNILVWSTSAFGSLLLLNRR